MYSYGACDVPVRELEDGESGFVLVATVAAYDGLPASSSVSSSLSNSLMMNQMQIYLEI